MRKLLGTSVLGSSPVGGVVRALVSLATASLINPDVIL